MHIPAAAARSPRSRLRRLAGAAALGLALASGPAHAADKEAAVIDVGLGESIIQRESRSIARVLISDPEVAELRLLEEGQYQVRGLATGSTDLWVWYRDDVQHPRSYRIVVSADLTDVGRRIEGTVGEAEPPKIYAVKDRLVVEGPVADVETLERITNIVRIYDEEFVNLMTVRGDHQVQLRVVFAELSRSTLRELGLNVFYNPPGFMGTMTGPNQSGTATAKYRDPSASNPQLNDGVIGSPGAAAFNLAAYVYGAVDMAGLLSVLEQNSIARTLAEPTLSALSGQQAEFLAGGEIPIPVAQQNNQISIEFKEYGVKVVFVPTVLSGDVIDMLAYVEVSEIDEANSTRLSGIEIPALTSRKGSSHLRLESGMTFALAGMLNEHINSVNARVPIIGDLPIVGTLFRYMKHERSETELVIFVTPQLIRPMAPGEVPEPPGATENFNPNDFDLFMLGALTKPGSRTAEPTGPIGMER
ncbi:MAG: type II and III secretion system protein family protein [Myxococcota bacterium]